MLILKNHIYANKPKTSEELEHAIMMEASRLSSQMVDKAVTNLETGRLSEDIQRSEGPVEHLLCTFQEVGNVVFMLLFVIIRHTTVFAI